MIRRFARVAQVAGAEIESSTLSGVSSTVVQQLLCDLPQEFAEDEMALECLSLGSTAADIVFMQAMHGTLSIWRFLLRTGVTREQYVQGQRAYMACPRLYVDGRKRGFSHECMIGLWERYQDIVKIKFYLRVMELRGSPADAAEAVEADTLQWRYTSLANLGVSHSEIMGLIKANISLLSIMGYMRSGRTLEEARVLTSSKGDWKSTE